MINIHEYSPHYIYNTYQPNNRAKTPINTPNHVYQNFCPEVNNYYGLTLNNSPIYMSSILVWTSERLKIKYYTNKKDDNGGPCIRAPIILPFATQ